jgi:agmatine deiminase
MLYLPSQLCRLSVRGIVMQQVVYIAKALERYLRVYSSIVIGCCENNIPIRVINGTQNIWCRDYMPIQIGTDTSCFMKFTYNKYGTEYPQLTVDEKCFEFLPHAVTDIVLDGGNCQTMHGRVFITDIIFQHNPHYKKHKLVERLSGLLQAEVILIPVEPGDTLGHTDGIVKPFGHNLVLVNDYSVMQDDEWKQYSDNLIETLLRRGVEPILFPYAYNKLPDMTEQEFREKYPDADDFNPGLGYYINFLTVNGVSFLPVFGFEEDAKAISILEKLNPDGKVIPIDCKDLSMEGGLINCVTKEYWM